MTRPALTRADVTLRAEIDPGGEHPAWWHIEIAGEHYLVVGRGNPTWPDDQPHTRVYPCGPAGDEVDWYGEHAEVDGWDRDAAITELLHVLNTVCR